MKIFVFNQNQPCLEIRTEKTKGPNFGIKYGINRDRYPDSGWGEIRSSRLSNATEVELTDELKVILLEDLAYGYGYDSELFNKKLKEFNLI